MTELLIATHNALVLWSNGRELVLHTGEGVYYGITWSQTELYVIARGYEPARSRVFAPNMWPLDDPPFRYTSRPGDGPHQALWWDGRLFVANTQADRLEWWDQNNHEIGAIHWERNVLGDNMDHVNSVWRDPETGRFWVAEHRRQLRPKRFRVLGPELEKLETIELDLACLVDGSTHCGLHNVYVEDDVLYTLGPSQLVLLDLQSGKPIEVELPGIVRYKHYLRGFARSVDAFFIGVSKASPGDGRGYGASQVIVLDNDLDKLGEINLDRRFGQLMEIRLVDEPDRAHNGVPCPLGALRTN